MACRSPSAYWVCSPRGRRCAHLVCYRGKRSTRSGNSTTLPAPTICGCYLIPVPISKIVLISENRILIVTPFPVAGIADSIQPSSHSGTGRDYGQQHRAWPRWSAGNRDGGLLVAGRFVEKGAPSVPDRQPVAKALRPGRENSGADTVARRRRHGRPDAPPKVNAKRVFTCPATPDTQPRSPRPRWEFAPWRPFGGEQNDS